MVLLAITSLLKCCFPDRQSFFYFNHTSHLLTGPSLSSRAGEGGLTNVTSGLVFWANCCGYWSSQGHRWAVQPLLLADTVPYIWWAHFSTGLST